MRRIVMRYVCLCLTMVLSNVSPRVKKRFPTLQHLVDAGKFIISVTKAERLHHLSCSKYCYHVCVFFDRLTGRK